MTYPAGFEAAFAATVGHEGGFQAHPEDRGNWTGGRVGVGRLVGTKYGISAASYPRVDIPRLTLEDARGIYLLDYWRRAGCDLVPEAIRGALFDAAVHHGTGTARRMLQRAIGEHPDGVIGPRTLQSLAAMPVTRVIARMLGERLALMTELPTWGDFGRGWARRIAEELRGA